MDPQYDVLARLDHLKNDLKSALLKENSPPPTLTSNNTQPPSTGAKTSKTSLSEGQSTKQSQPMSKIDEVRSKIIGFTTRYMSPFRIEMEAVYVDHTATNRPYQDVEDMVDYAKLLAANPHT